VQHFIVVEGLIGVGKSTLCRLLSREWGMKTVLEPAETNPFLELFYRDPGRYSFPVQMFYLVTRWKQQQAIRQQELFESGVVSDYLFAKDRLFAEKTLDETELELYDSFAAALGESTPKPDLLVYLEAPIDTVMERIHKRCAPGEEKISREYIRDLSKRYDLLLDDWEASPILRIDNANIDYAGNVHHQQLVLDMIHAALTGEPAPKAPSSNLEREAQPNLFGSGFY